MYTHVGGLGLRPTGKSFRVRFVRALRMQCDVKLRGHVRGWCSWRLAVLVRLSSRKGWEWALLFAWTCVKIACSLFFFNMSMFLGDMRDDNCRLNLR